MFDQLYPDPIITKLAKKNIVNKKQGIEEIKFPLVETIDLRLNKPNETFSLPFHRITRIIWVLRWEDNASAFIATNFMGEVTPLTNGINIKYNEIDIIHPSNLKSNTSFAKVAYDTQLIIDDKAAPNQAYVWVSRFSFFKFVPKGLLVSGNNTFRIFSNDNLSAVGLKITATLEGWGLY